MENIDHFSHEDPLVLLGEEVVKYDSEDEEEQKHDYSADDIQKLHCCNGCLDPISLSTGAYYGCVNKCGFFLHKFCAQLPRQINHPLHPNHELILEAERNCRCDGCKRDWENFTYNCYKCDYDLDIFCATMDRKFEHKSHIHPLIRLRQPGLFECYACNTEHKGIFYHCSTCPLFFIHVDCFSLPTTIKCTDHEDHPLVLAYSVPSQYTTFWNDCDICSKILEEEKWIYYCGICRFLAHVNCAASKIEPFMSIILPRRAPKLTNEEVGNYGRDVIRFPFVDQSATLISYLLKGLSITEDESSTTNNPEVAQIIDHFSHDHPLLLVDLEEEMSENGSSISSKLQMCLMNDTRVNETICNACVRPISAIPFYRCSTNNQFCNFFLHKCCAELPSKIDQHPFHPQHPLILLPKSNMFFNVFKCKGCRMYCNGFSYYCASCDLYLDVQCGSLPKTVIHEGHHPNHLLSLKGTISNSCNSCIWRTNKPILAYRCNSCDYELDSYCVVLSNKVRHRYDDDHPFILTYNHVKGHTDEYICDLCEGELNPKTWYYHCIECDRSIHRKCLRPFYSWSNIKFYGGRTLNIESHPHPVVLGPVIQEDTKVNNSLPVAQHKTECDRCFNEFFKDPLYFESKLSFGFICVQCSFKLCYDCAKSCTKEQEGVD